MRAGKCLLDRVDDRVRVEAHVVDARRHLDHERRFSPPQPDTFAAPGNASSAGAIVCSSSDRTSSIGDTSLFR
ncbi:MAG TPA: hypothetical protein VGH28_12485 [Polyangiaceae bacterium]